MKKELRSDAFLQDAMERWGDMVYRLALGHAGNIADAEVFIRMYFCAYCGIRPLLKQKNT